MFANARLRRIGSCPVVQIDPAEPFPLVFPRFKTDGGMAENPLDLGQDPLPEELEFDQ